MPEYGTKQSSTVKSSADADVRITLSAAEKKSGLEIKQVSGHSRDMVCIKPGSEAMAQALEAAYGISPEDAELIIKERDANPERWPFDEYKKAKAVLAAFKASPVAIDDSPHYKRLRRMTTV